MAKMNRRRFLKLAAAAGALLAVPTTYGAAFEVNHLVLNTVMLHIPGLAMRWQGQRIVQLSDLHASRIVSRKLLTRAFERAAALEPAAIVVTGDWISNSLSHFGDLREALSRVPRSVPVIGTLGNHDSGKNWRNHVLANELCERLGDLGVLMLRNESYQPFAGAGELAIVGVNDLWSGTMNPAKAFANVPADAGVIVLSHNPDTFENLSPYAFHAMLSGHTHGGQVRIPGPFLFSTQHHERSKGLYLLRAPDGSLRPLYVNVGVGNFCHIRVNCPPEITCFILSAGAKTGAVSVQLATYD